MLSEEYLKNLPENPGVYLMKDSEGVILYVGKAISLKKRVRSYFSKTADQNLKLGSLVPQINSIDYIVTSSELEALILENALIKKHKPKYNILLRDDKNYPYLCLTTSENYPRLIVTRKARKDKNLYFGPYIPASALRRTLKAIYQLFPLRQCSRISKRDRPCLQHQMKRCGGPCADEIDTKEYQSIVQQVKLFLLGQRESLLNSLEKKMQEAAEKLEYEKAGMIRDQIQAIRKTLQPQNVFSAQLKNKDIIHYARSGDLIIVVVFFVRYGQLLGKKDFLLSVPTITLDEEALSSFLKQFYSQEILIPKTILLGCRIAEAEIIESWLSEKRGSPVNLFFPKSGEGKKQLDLVRQNARILLEAYLVKTLLTDPTLRTLAYDLNLPKIPVRIEAFDISNLSGSEAVGSMVCWINNKPAKSDYRRFKIQHVTGIDDYAMMREVINRRYKRLLEENKELPDLILIDGGKGHLQAGLEALEELNISKVSVISLAKKEEEIFMPGRPEALRLSRHSPGLQLLQRIRDEAHRFAITYHRLRRKKSMLDSPLLQIKGIGQTRQKALLRYFGSINKIKKASLEDLSGAPGIDNRTSHQVFHFFHSPEGK